MKIIFHLTIIFQFIPVSFNVNDYVLSLVHFIHILLCVWTDGGVRDACKLWSNSAVPWSWSLLSNLSVRHTLETDLLHTDIFSKSESWAISNSHSVVQVILLKAATGGRFQMWSQNQTVSSYKLSFKVMEWKQTYLLHSFNNNGAKRMTH